MKDIRNTITELCKYYMEFLESDFKANKLPSRRINIDTDEDKRIINIKEYENFENKMLKCFLEKFSPNNFKVERRQYVQHLPTDIIAKIVETINKSKSSFNDALKDKISKLMSNFRKLSKDKVNEIIADMEKNIGNIQEYLKNLIISDLYEEIFELWKNKQVSEIDEFYLYFYEISYKNNQYPLFYIQLITNPTDRGDYEFEFSPVLLVNKKALQYISENYAKEYDVKWKIDISERQIYLGNYKELSDFIEQIEVTFNAITDFLKSERVNLNNKNESIIKNGVEINRRAYIAIFDKSDEAILNDYEEMLNLLLTQNSSLSLEFLMKLSKEFIFENPKTFHREVETEYEEKPLGDKLNYNNPVPLNKEQLQVIHALNKEECDRIIIHGPPGTGKSHTITAIIYDALLNKKSVLVVSDKKEALDVVEDKITEVIEKMKVDDYLQNPILRLGKTETNYNSIFTQVNYDRIKSRYYAYSKNRDQIENQIENINGKIIDDIEKNINYEMSISPKVVKMLIDYEKIFNKEWVDSIDIDEIMSGNKYGDFKLLYEWVNNFVTKINEFAEYFGVDICDYFNNSTELHKHLKRLNQSLLQVNTVYLSNCRDKCLFKNSIDESNIQLLENAVREYEQMKRPIIGYFFCSKKVKELQSKLSHALITYEPINFKKDYQSIVKEVQFYQILNRVSPYFGDINLNCYELFRENKLDLLLKYTDELSEIINYLESVKVKLPSTMGKLKLNFKNLSEFKNNKLTKVDIESINSLIEYLKQNQDIKKNMNCNFDDFLDNKKQIEDRLILKMTNILDESVINFRENYKNDAEELKRIIKQKKKISKSLLDKLINAFPCLIVNIRDLGEYIPLEANIFDIVIIDEASQVSVAQAFPAIIRGKKIVVLGDEQQFSNVKANNASIDTNNYLFNRVRSAFQEEVSDYDDDTKGMVLDKISKFSIKNSILSFIKNVSNYECILKKHFRGYMEIIGYSNRVFYGGTLEVMKIRGKSIDNVIQFKKVDCDDKVDIYKNTNMTEALLIIDELKQLRDSNFHGTVGVISPFKNQQKLIYNMIHNSGDWNDYERKFKLKVMTFDSCQGDEKDIIYYSMVEKEGEELLKHIFPIDFNKISIEEDGSLKAKRLNVGLSRAKESIRFIISKDVESFKGEIGNALKEYARLLDEPDNYGLILKTDPNSPMEKIVYNYIIQTKFYENYKNRIEIIPQFNVGRYIKQLDPYAKIPNYRTDFLLILKGEKKEKFIIIEYDGFEYHFTGNHDYINELNYDKFYIESDIERRKTIELYGYKFIRINKFNLGDNPIERLNARLERAVKKTNDFILSDINTTYEKIQSNEEKVCIRCGEVKAEEEFYDDTLKSGIGKVCTACKEKQKYANKKVMA